MTPLTVVAIALAVILARVAWTTLRHDRRVQIRLNLWRQWRAQRALKAMQRGEG